MKQRKNDSVYEINQIYKYSRHYYLMKKFIPEHIYILFIFVTIFSVLIFFYINTIIFLPIMGTYLLYIILHKNIMHKKINDAIIKKQKLKKLNSRELHSLLGVKKIFFINFYDTTYAEIIYFQYLLKKSNLKNKDIKCAFENFRFKTSHYVKNSEGTSFNAIIGLIAGLLVLVFDRISEGTIWNAKTLLGAFIIIVACILFISTLYGITSLFNIKNQRDKEITGLLEYKLLQKK